MLLPRFWTPAQSAVTTDCERALNVPVQVTILGNGASLAVCDL